VPRVGTLSSSQAGGIVIGPLVGGVLADIVGFRALFFITAAIEILAALGVLLLVHERRRAGAQPSHSLLANLRLAARAPLPIAIFGLFLTQCSILLVQPFFALFVESLGVRPGRLSSWTGVLFGVTGLATLLAAPRWGRLGDRLGRRRALIVAFAGGTAVFLLQGVAQNVQHLFALRLLQGAFAAGMLPTLYAAMALHTPEAQRAGVMAFGSSATLLGGLAGPVVGGLLASQLGMRPVFLISTALFALNALNAMRLPPDPGRAPARAPGRSWELPAQ
jgi:DHA1 family multidrug resistance protein-like MFS transporter